MANIYQKTVTDKTCILSPREYILRPFDFGTDWTEVRIGAYFSGIAASGDNTDSAAETVALASASDRIAFGIKDSATSDLPGFGAALFLGAVTETSSSSYCSGSAFSALAATRLAAAGYHETTLVGGTSTLSASMEYPASASGSTGYCGFFALKFVITNLGTASQSVAISGTRTATVSGTDYSASALQLLMNNNTYQAPVSIAWNDGAIARTIPDAFYCRMPFYSNRIRLSAIRCIRYAP
jgi:hypothetical protein